MLQAVRRHDCDAAATGEWSAERERDQRARRHDDPLRVAAPAVGAETVKRGQRSGRQRAQAGHAPQAYC